MGDADHAANGARRLVLLGPPGSGKGTQAEQLAGRLGVPWISTGEILRQAVTAGSELGRRVASILDRGDLVDDRTMAALIEERLARADAATGFILDGYPRTVPQAETLAGILAERGVDLDRVLLVGVPEPVLMGRILKRMRGADDTETAIRRRLEEYGNKTAPLIGYYRDRALLAEIDGDQPITAVTAEILGAIEGK